MIKLVAVMGLRGTRESSAAMGCIRVASVIMLALAEAASATTSLSQFVIFSGGGASPNSRSNYETSIGGHTVVNGNIGSNQDLFQQGNPLPGFPAMLNGSAYVGGYLTMGQDLTVGSALIPREIVVNGINVDAPAGAAEAVFGGFLYGNLFVTGQASNLTVDLSASARVFGNVSYGGGTCPRCDATHVTGSVTSPSSQTFSLVSMLTPTGFTAGGANKTCSGGGCTSLTLDPGTYGTLSTGTTKTINLSSGNYYFDALSIGGSNTFNIDLSSGAPINVYLVGLADFAQSGVLKVKGAGTGGSYLAINDPNARALAGLIYWETHDKWVMAGGTDPSRQIWGGTVYASTREDATAGGTVAELDFGQYVDWTGAAYAYDSFSTADHGVWNYVPLSDVPEPAPVVLLGAGLVAIAARLRGKPAA